MTAGTGYEDKIIDIFRYNLQIDVPSVDTDLIGEGILDSLSFVGMLLTLEEEFGIKLSIEELDIAHFKTVSNISGYLRMRENKITVEGK